MSWQAYVDSSLVGSGNVDKAAIFSKAGDSVWAASSGFTLSKEEITKIVESFTDKGDSSGFKQISANGFYVGGEKFVTLLAEGRSLYGKKGKEGIVIVQTTQALLIAHYPETVQPGAAANTVEQLADYLTGLGY
ncbi:profilin-A [Pseudovirgaria hyperparasitica]|uniref:Profilin n=1 Tax=Pseudovirgaria hyperparasitica TaxID=470096 RepID=A0A6A6WGP0_9PEZI|nr:profilin-A [Pseudovirgaria hyperparasitica]KAF2761379.1 profilin-A [Pseudovirgaria hyperparasitica]